MAYVDSFDLIAADFKLCCFIGEDITPVNQIVTMHCDELLSL